MSRPLNPIPDLALPSRSLLGNWKRFWFDARNPFGLHLVRLLAGLLFLSWLITLAGYQNDLFGLQGFYDLQAYKETARESRRPGQPIQVPVTWSLLYMAGTNTALLNTMFFVTIGILILFTLGIATRWTALLSWLLIASFVNNPVIMYDADHLLLLLAFYLMVGYLLEGWWNGTRSARNWILGTPDAHAWELGRETNRVSVAANLALRLIQVHFAIVIVTSALHKLQFGDWWSGVAFWYPMHPPLETTKDKLLLEKPFAQDHFIWLSLTQYLMLAWQLAFPLFAWKRSWRPLLIVGAILGWIGCLEIFGMPLFGPILLIVSLSYVEQDEWQALGHWINRLRGKNFVTESALVAARN